MVTHPNTNPAEPGLSSELVYLPSLFSNTTLPSLRFSTLIVFPLPSLRELLRISYFLVITVAPWLPVRHYWELSFDFLAPFGFLLPALYSIWRGTPSVEPTKDSRLTHQETARWRPNAHVQSTRAVLMAKKTRENERACWLWRVSSDVPFKLKWSIDRLSFFSWG